MKFCLFFILSFGLLFTNYSCSQNISSTNNKGTDQDSTSGKQTGEPIYLADPTILYSNGTYYLYGTKTVNRGFLVFTSINLKKWKGPAGKVNGLALRKQDVYGNGNFWAPQVFKYHNKFYMAYVADQHIAIAESNSPLGPFTQKVKKPLITAVQTIDSYVFIDSDGKKYLYHVRLQNGNRIYVVQLNDDFSAVKPNTLTSCINAVEHPQVWENVANAAWSVTEDPTVLKHNGKYYLFYSANDYRNINYAVGYAVADSPFGPWKKYSGNPILNRYLVGKNGTGGGDFFQNAATGQYYYVFHTHYSNVKVSPRRTAIIKGRFVPGNDSTDKMVFNKNSFRYLKKY